MKKEECTILDDVIKLLEDFSGSLREYVKGESMKKCRAFLPSYCFSVETTDQITATGGTLSNKLSEIEKNLKNTLENSVFLRFAGDPHLAVSQT